MGVGTSVALLVELAAAIWLVSRHHGALSTATAGGWDDEAALFERLRGVFGFILLGAISLTMSFPSLALAHAFAVHASIAMLLAVIAMQTDHFRKARLNGEVEASAANRRADARCEAIVRQTESQSAFFERMMDENASLRDQLRALDADSNRTATKKAL